MYSLYLRKNEAGNPIDFLVKFGLLKIVNV